MIRSCHWLLISWNKSLQLYIVYMNHIDHMYHVFNGGDIAVSDASKQDYTDTSFFLSGQYNISQVKKVL